MIYLTPNQAQDKSLIRYLAEQTIKEPIHSIQKLGGGCSWNYDLNGHIIFKLPKESSLIQSWENQAAIASILQSRLNVQIPSLKKKEVFLSGTSQQALTSINYEKIQGVCIAPENFHTMPQKFKEKYFDQLTEIMLQLHSIPLELFPFEFMTKLEYLKRYFIKKLGKHHTTLIEKSLTKLVFNRFFGFRKEEFKNDKLCHSDLHSGNVCLDSRGRIVGILDFESLTRGDPILEFRPFLYGHKDMRLFLNKYLKKTPYPFDLQKINKINHIGYSIIFFYTLYKLYHFGVKKTKPLQYIRCNHQKI